MNMTLKHQWNSRQRHILLYFKAFCRNVPDFDIRMEDMLLMQQSMAEEIRRAGGKAEFYTLWKYFGRSGFPGCVRNNDTALLKNAFIQMALGVFSQCPVLEPLFASELYHCGNALFARRYPCSDINVLKITLRDTKILELALNKEVAQVKLMYDLSRNRACKLKNVYHILLNHKEYDIVMQINGLCGQLEKIDYNVLESHFYEPSNDAGKSKFNDFFMEHFPVHEDFYFWQRHRYHDNLSAILLPALERGLSPRKVLLPVGSRNVDLHTFLAFIDELKEILAMDKHKEIFRRFQEDLKCAGLYFNWLEKKGYEGNTHEAPVD